MGLKDVEETLPPGFRFNPSDEELVCHYLYNKIANQEGEKGTLLDIDLHTCEPWHLPEAAKLNASEWYFFSFRDRKYATGYRTNRATTSGYWKATGKDRVILNPKNKQVVGMRKTLVFYQNRAPNGVKTPWIMHEFRMETPHMPPKEDWVLCRVFYKTKGEANTHHNLHILEPFKGTTSTLSSSPPPLVDAYAVDTPCKYQGFESSTDPYAQIQPVTQYSSARVDPTLLNHDTHLIELLKEGSTTGYTMTNSSTNGNDGHDRVHEADHNELLWDMGIDHRCHNEWSPSWTSS